MRGAERRKVNVLEMKCLRSLVGVSRMDRVTNEEVCRRGAGIERELASRHGFMLTLTGVTQCSRVGDAKRVSNASWVTRCGVMTSRRQQRYRYDRFEWHMLSTPIMK